MSDIVRQINDVHREVGRREVDGEEARTVLLSRTYPAGA
ncbi:polyketide cyclase, partial [Streptomyces sp. SID7760]|nr:polyketide cyclase [Streptomyces sp. SID7760]